nr:putative zinc finger, CCHC-type [Tanacetum cinerariifolium]
MWNISIWSKDHPDAHKWIEANGQWLYDNFDHCEVETSDDDDKARSLWSLDDNEHFDPFEDDPTHPDARWRQDNAGEALLIDVNSNATPTYTYAPVRSTSAPEFVRHENGLVEIKFSSSRSKSDNVFRTGIHMITPTDQEPAQEIKHTWWDVCNCEGCLDEAAKIDDDDEDLLKKRKSSQRKLKRRYEKELQYYTIDVVIKRFLTRLQGRLRDWLQGRLRDWYHSLGEYRQLQIQQSISLEAFMSIIYSEFIGSPWEHTAHAREEFLKMKCCSFQNKDLEKHYNHMSQRFYCLNGVDDVNLKQVFLNSFPEYLGNEAYRALEAKNVTIAQTTLGELYQLILNALAKLCNPKKFLAEFERTGKRLRTACGEKYLQIKCKDKSSCDCTHIKKKFHSKRFSGLSGKPWFSRQSNKKWKFIRKKKQRGKTSDRCFICQKRGHFTRNCPDKKRSQALI